MKRDLLFFILLVLCCFSIYFNSLSFNFTHLDDQVQVVNNPSIRSLSWANIKSIFSSTSVGMYQPISTFFYAIAYQINELNPSTYGAFSLTFHLLNSLLVFSLLKRLNINTLLNYFLVLIFCLHPMQVESVAWVSAFSNLVFSCFYLLSLLAHLQFNKCAKKKYYVVSILLFILATLSKSMAITLPVFLVFITLSQSKQAKNKWILLLPYFIIALIIGLITIYSRESAGHLSDLSVHFNWFDRVFLISYSILFYPIKFLIPISLSVFYPYPELSQGLLPWQYYLSLPAVILISYFLWKYKRNRLLVLGAAFYLISISVVLQLIPVGNQLTTDRYIYQPMIGLLIITGHFLSRLKANAIPLLFVIPFLFAFASHQRTSIWENDQKIWEDVIDKYPNVAQAHNNLGSYLLKENKKKQAFSEFNKAIQLKPYYADAYSNRGILYAQQGNYSKARSDYNKAIKLRPHADAYFNRANAYAQQGQMQNALNDYTNSLNLSENPDAYTNRAYVYLQLKSSQLAIADLKQAIKLNPKYARAYFLLGMSHQMEQNSSKACKAFSKAIDYGDKNAALAYRDYCTKR